MTKIVNKTVEKLPRQYSKEEAKEMAISALNGTIDGSTELRKLAEKEFPRLSIGDIINEETMKIVRAVSAVYSQESGYALLISVDPQYKGFALKLRKSLLKEFDCTTASEIALVDHAVNAHIRELSNSALLESMNEPRWISHEKVELMKLYSCEIDRAHRQFVSAIETLRTIKQPTLKVNVRAQTAFIAHNQQLNNSSEETNEST